MRSDVMRNLFLDHSLPDLCQQLTKKELSCCDLAVEVSRVIEKNEDKTRAWVCYDLEQLLYEAKKKDLELKTSHIRHDLEGIPFGVKDIFNTKAFPTEMGSPTWKGFTPGNNARVVDSLLFSGGIVAGKTVTAEFAVHALNETLNPHDLLRTPGTSSSGSVAAVATGMVPFALATQTAGSIIRPASFCGVWGMKPSFGMIPRTGVLKTTDSLDTIGFVAAHAESLRVLLNHTRVKGPNYPFVYRYVDRFGDYPKESQRSWRVGFVKTHTWSMAKDYVKTEMQALIQKIGCEEGFSIEEIEWPAELEHVHQTHATIYTKSLSYYFQNEKRMASQITPIMHQMIAEGEPVSPAQYKEALQRQACFAQQLDRLLAPYDFVLSMGTSSAAPFRGQEEIPDPSLIWTLGQVPSIAAPVFRCPDNLPFAAQFISRKWSDYRLLQGVEALVKRGVLPAGSQKIYSMMPDNHKLPSEYV